MPDVVLVAKARQYCETGIAQERLERAGLSNGEVGSAVGVDRVTVYRWLKSQRRPHGEPAARFAQLLDELVIAGAA